MNIVDYVLIALVLAAVTGALLYLRKQKKAGGCIGCSGGGKGCCGCCNLAAPDKKGGI